MKFKSGDRVAVYGHNTFMYKRGTGHVTRFDEGFLGIIADDERTLRDGWSMTRGYHLAADPKQCRLLKKRERRRIWISRKLLEEWLNDYLNEYKVPVYSDPPGHNHLYAEFVEARKKK